MQYSFHGLTDTGCVRSNNEDALLVDPGHDVIMLADGMGGYNAGEVASRMAIDLMQAELSTWLKSHPSCDDLDCVTEALQECADKANQSILDAAQSEPQFAGMGTTLVVGLFLGPTLVLGHVGDSRCYRLRNSMLAQITRDHSLLQEQMDAGLLTREQAATAPGRNLLTRALGVTPGTCIETHVHLVESDDIYLLCSDGLSDMIADPDIARLLSQPGSLETLARMLIDQALAKGGRDNVSVVLARAQPRSIASAQAAAGQGRP